MEHETPKDWAGKVVIVYVKKSGPATEAGMSMQDPRIETYYGRRFLVGSVPPHEKDCSAHLLAGVRWDQIVNLLVFDSLAEFQKCVRESPPTWEMSRTKRGSGPPS